MAFSDDEICDLKQIHGMHQMGYPLTGALLLKAEMMERRGIVQKNEEGLFIISSDAQFELFSQGILLPPKRKRRFTL